MGRRNLISASCVLTLALVAAAQTARAPEESSAKPEFSPQVADQILRALRNAILDQDSARLLRLFDRDRMPDYAEFSAGVSTVFSRYENFRVRYQILQTAEEDRSAVVELTVEATPVGNPAVSNAAPSVRHSEQIRFTFKQTGKDWKIAEMQPRDLFGKF